MAGLDRALFVVSGVLMVSAFVADWRAVATRRRADLRFGFWGGVAALLALLIGLVWRGAEAGYWPVQTTYEFGWALVAAVLIAHAYLVQRSEMSIAVVAALLLALLLAAALLVFMPTSAKAPRAPLPVDASAWFVVHTLTAAWGSGIIAVAGMIGIVYLTVPWVPALAQRLPELASPRGAESLDRAAGALIRLGFPWMTLSVLAAGIWAQLTSGTTWNWELRPTWALIVWLIYLFYRHTRDIPGWAGKRASFVSTIALLVVLSSILATPYLPPGTNAAVFK